MADGKTELAQKAPAAEIKKLVSEFTRMTNLSSDYSGQAGQYLRNQTERLGISARTIRQLRTMERQDEAKRQSTIRETLHGWIAMGYFDQADMFDDVFTDLRELVAKKESGVPASEPPANSDTAAPPAVDAKAAEKPAGKPKGGKAAAAKADETFDPQAVRKPAANKAKPDATLDSLVH